MRCQCKRQKQRWPCSRVQDALQAAGHAREYGPTTPLRLLACDAQCAAARSSSAGGGAKPAGGVTSNEARERAPKTPSPFPQAQQRTKEVAAAPSCDSTAGSGAEGARAAKRLTRAEREALAAKRAEEQLRKERTKRRVDMLKRSALPFFFAVAAALLVWSVLHFL